MTQWDKKKNGEREKRSLWSVTCDTTKVKLIRHQLSGKMSRREKRRALNFFFFTFIKRKVFLFLLFLQSNMKLPIKRQKWNIEQNEMSWLLLTVTVLARLFLSVRLKDTLIFTWNGGQLTADKNKFTGYPLVRSVPRLRIRPGETEMSVEGRRSMKWKDLLNLLFCYFPSHLQRRPERRIICHESKAKFDIIWVIV